MAKEPIKTVQIYVLSKTGASASEQCVTDVTNLVLNGVDRNGLDGVTGAVVHSGPDLLVTKNLICLLKTDLNARVAILSEDGTEMFLLAAGPGHPGISDVISILEAGAAAGKDSWTALSPAIPKERTEN